MFHDALDYLAGLIPECRGILVVVIDAYQARPAEIAARFLRFMALSGDSGRFIADIALIPAIYFYIGARIEDHHRHRRSSLRSAVARQARNTHQRAAQAVILLRRAGSTGNATAGA